MFNGIGYRAIGAIVAVLGLPFCCTAEKPDSSWKASLSWQSTLAGKPTKTIVDYFLLLPSSVLDCESASGGYPTEESRKKIIVTSDIKNGYLQFFKKAQIAVFKNRTDKTDIIAIQSGLSGSGSTCGAVNALFSFDSKTRTWVNRDELLPKGFKHTELYDRLSEKEILPYFMLPQKGIEILVKDENTDSTISRLAWNGQRFLVK